MIELTCIGFGLLAIAVALELERRHRRRLVLLQGQMGDLRMRLEKARAQVERLEQAGRRQWRAPR